MKARIITTDGQITDRELDQPLTLKELQSIVGGLIEGIGLDGKPWVIMYLNEEGKLLNLQINYKATEIARPYIQHWDYIAGDAVLLDYFD